MDERILRHLLRDPVPHLFLAYDLMFEAERCMVWGALEGDELRGYLLFWSVNRSWILEAESIDHAKPLIELINPTGSTIIASEKLSGLIESRLNPLRKVSWILMMVERGHENLCDSRDVIPLGLSELDDIVNLYRSEAGWGRDRELVEDWIRRLPAFGYFKEGKLVSIAGLLSKSPWGGLIGGVFTHPKFRRMGYGCKTTSAATAYALENFGLAALYVDSRNKPAINLYLKLGYKPHSRKIFYPFR